MKKKILSILGAVLISTSIVTAPAMATSQTSSNTSNSQAIQSEIPEVTGTDLSKEEGLKIFNEMQTKNAAIDNLDYNLSAKMKSEGMNMAFKGEGTVDIKNAGISFKSNIMGKDIALYVKDKKMYVNNPETNEYVYFMMPITEKLLRVTRPVDPRTLDLFKVKKTEAGYVISTDGVKSMKEISDVFAEVEFYNELIKSNINEAIKSDKTNSEDDEKFLNMFEGMNDSIKYNIYMEIDENLIMKNFIIEYSVDLEKVQEMDKNAPKDMTFVIKSEVANVNSAKEITLPEEAKSAKIFTELDSSSNYKPSTQSNTMKTTKAN